MQINFFPPLKSGGREVSGKWNRVMNFPTFLFPFHFTLLYFPVSISFSLMYIRTTYKYHSVSLSLQHQKIVIFFLSLSWQEIDTILQRLQSDSPFYLQRGIKSMSVISFSWKKSKINPSTVLAEIIRNSRIDRNTTSKVIHRNPRQNWKSPLVWNTYSIKMTITIFWQFGKGYSFHDCESLKALYYSVFVCILIFNIIDCE